MSIKYRDELMYNVIEVLSSEHIACSQLSEDNNDNKHSCLFFKIKSTKKIYISLTNTKLLEINLRENIFVPDIGINIHFFDGEVKIESEAFNPKLELGPFDSFNVVNNFNVHSLYSKAFIIPGGIKLSSSYTFQTIDNSQKKEVRYNEEKSTKIIIEKIKLMIISIYDVYLLVNR